MTRSNKFLAVASLLAICTFIFVLLSDGVIAKNSFSIGKKFDNHTYIGPFDISNHKTKQAKSKLAADFSELQTKLDVNLIYQDFQFTLPPEIIKFDIDMTLANVNSGEDNPIIAAVSLEGLTTVLNQELPWIQFNEEAVDSVAAGIVKELETGIMPSNVHITDYLAADVVPDQAVAASETGISGMTPALSEALHALNNTSIMPFESFSMMDVLMSAGAGSLSDEEMTLLSSVMYRAVLQTNFQIDERNIRTALTPGIQLGFEAAMDQTLGLDFKFTNPNKTGFTIQATGSTEKILLSIVGKPFYYIYEPYTADSEAYKPRTIIQYSAFVHNGQNVVSQEGEDGVEAIVQRTISFNGTVVDTEDISKDFYAPVHRIEVHPLAKGASATDASASVETDPAQNNATPPEIENEPSSKEEIGSIDSGEMDETINEELKEEIIYDKSGLPLSGK